ncbi:MAG: Calx-beta domain-containing protein, partial [Eubacteriales bacterium]|nr:Calx-beta domain-containing protein [Eubacteriales bacterium]
ENDVIKDKADTETHKLKQDAADKDKTSSSEASKSTADKQDTDEEALKGADEQATGKEALKDEDEQGTDENDLKKEDEADDAEEPDETGKIEDKDKSDSVLSVVGSDAVSTGKSRLAILKEEATGEPTREEGSSGVSGSLTDAILAQIMPEQIEAIPHSAEQTITFAPGENVQYLKFRIHDDKLSEGTEAFSVMITDAENMEPYMVTSLSVIITDDEESEQSEISFDSDAYAVEDGKALVTLQREGAEYSMASANIRGKDAETGANQVYGTVVFAPYETEKEVELAVTKDSTLYLSDYLAAQAGNTTEADAVMTDGTERSMLLSGISMLSDEDEDAAVTSLAAENAAEELSFDIDIAGKKYKVKYKKGDVVADIYDEGYTPALEVGQYYFSASTDVGGIFSYGKDQRHGSKPNKLGTLQNCYVIANEEKDFSKGYGKLEYLHTTTWCTGSVWSSNEHPPAGSPTINGLYYQYLIPHWEQTSSYGGGNKVRLKLHAIGAGNDFGQKDKDYKFGKELSSGAAVKVQNIADNIEAIVYAVDDWKTMTPKSYMRFYGIAAMYKKYRVNVENPDKKDFLGAPASVPMQVKMECGAQIIEPGHTDSRDIYTNIDTDDANLVFTLNKNTINGVDGIFGTITGYTITVSSKDPDDKKRVNVNYPSDYLKYLDGMVGKSVNSDAIDLSKEAVKTVKERATAHLDTIVMDKYFVNWIESIQ